MGLEAGDSVSKSVTGLEQALPSDFRRRLEQARLDLRALFRASDQMGIGQDLPDELHRLFELDADFAEALHVMDLGPRSIDVRAMLRDTERALVAMGTARAEYFATLEARARKRLEANLAMVRASLGTADAYIDIPGRDPTAS